MEFDEFKTVEDVPGNTAKNAESLFKKISYALADDEDESPPLNFSDLKWWLHTVVFLQTKKPR